MSSPSILHAAGQQTANQVVPHQHREQHDGSITSVPPAAIFPHSLPSYCMKLTMATGAVIAWCG
jgi:hypothetical protein